MLDINYPYPRFFLKNLLLFIILVSGSSLAQTNIYISLQGNDEWSGRVSMPNETKTDGPYRTFKKTFAEIARIKKTTGYPPKGINVIIREGKYHITSPLVIDDAVGGTESSPLSIFPFNNETVILTGATEIPNFNHVRDKSILSKLDADVRDSVLVADMGAYTDSFGSIDSISTRFDLLFKGEQMNLSRYPKTGFLDFFDTSAIIANGALRYKLKIKHDSHISKWDRDTNIYAFGYWSDDWYSTYQRVFIIDANQNYVTVTGNPPFGYSPKSKFTHLVQRFYLVNILSEVNRPGDYYFNRAERKIYFYPPSNLTEYPEFSNIKEVFKLHVCKNINLSGIIIEGASIGVIIEKSSNCTVTNCKIRNVTAYNLFIDRSQDITISNNDIYNSSSQGIHLDDCGDRVALKGNNIKIIDNTIHDLHKQFNANRGGVVLQNCVGTYVKNNTIYNSPTSGIFVVGNDNVIEYNELYNVAYEIQDVGGIYTWGDITSQGNIIRYNYIHDVQSIYRHQKPELNHRSEAIHLDGYSSGWLVYGNIFNKCGTGVLVEGGSDNAIKNNIFYKCAYGIVMRVVDIKNYPTNKKEIISTSSRYPYRDSPAWQKYLRLKTLLDDSTYSMKYNSCTNNIMVKVDSVFSVSNHDLKLMNLKDNYVTNTQVPFNENPLTFEITKYQNNIKAIGFKPIPGKIKGLPK